MMDNKKFEKLIDLIINENDEQARELFHDIVVEKSREIYESMMADEEVVEGYDEMEEGGQVDGLLDEISYEEQGMTEEDDEFADIDMSDDDEEMGDEDREEADLEDRVVDLEDKLDELMAEFEELMGQEGDDDMGDDDMDMGDDDMGDDDMGDDDMMESSDDYQEVEESLEESIQLKQVPGLYGSKIGGDDGANTRSPALSKPKVVQTGAKAVNMTGTAETVPTGPKAPGNYGTKGETSVKHANDWKNSPTHKGAKTEAAPKAHTAQATQVNTKSPVAEGRKATKKKV